MSEERSAIEHPPPFGTVPDEFIDPEGDGEFYDPALGLESTAGMREAWSDWLCARGPGEFADVQFFGKGIGGVPAPAVEAFKALEAALIATGYQPRSSWSNKCRKIKNTDRYSLHAYGVAIDIDPSENPQSSGLPFSGKIQKSHVDAALAIKNTAGRGVWNWGGTWSTPDRMHFQLDQGPNDLAIDPLTVPGAVHVALEAVTHKVTARSLNLRTEPTTSGALIAGLPQGAEVAAQAGPIQESDGYEWVRIEAVVGGQLRAGWVAGQYLEAVDRNVSPAAPAVTPVRQAVVVPQGELHMAGATHRVKASSLNLRQEPTTSGALLASLPDGAEITGKPGTAQENDDYVWIQITAAVEGGIVEGWVASKYLEALP